MASIGTWPTSLRPESFLLYPETNQIVNSSPHGGNEQAVDRLNDRWRASITLPIRTHADSRGLEAFLALFRGQVNWVDLWHLGQWSGRPRGTMRGSRVLQAAASQGADELRITTDPGDTLLAGDMLGVGGLLIMVAEDCVAGGGGTLVAPIANRIRTAQALGAAVTWDKPTAPFRLTSHAGVNYVFGHSDAVTLELRERIA